MNARTNHPADRYLAALTSDQRARLNADADLRAAFDAYLAPFLPKPVGVSWSGMSGETWVPVEACFGNAERKVRFERQRLADQAVAPLGRSSTDAGLRALGRAA